MARVEIEERAWSDPKLKRLVAVLKSSGLKSSICRSLAIGLVTTLWHDSQAEDKKSCTKNDIEHWFAEEISDSVDILGMLQASGYIENLGDDSYKIDGNTHRVDKVSAYKSRAKAAAQTRWQTIKKQSDSVITNKKQRVKPDAPSIRKQCLQKNVSIGLAMPTTNNKHQTTNKEELSSLRSDASTLVVAQKVNTPQELAPWDDGYVAPPKILAPWDDGYIEEPVAPIETPHIRSSGTLVQIDEKGVSGTSTSKRGKNASKTKSASSLGTNEVIAEYVELYKEKFGGTAPAIGPRNARAAKEVVAQFGVEKTKAILKTYLGMGDRWFATKHYDLVTFAGNLNAVLLYHDKGLSITSTMAKTIETTANNDAVCARLIARYANKERQV